MPYTTTVLDGTATFGLAGVTTFFNDSAWRTLAVAATLASLALTILGWPQSRLGFVLNLMLLAYLFLGSFTAIHGGSS